MECHIYPTDEKEEKNRATGCHFKETYKVKTLNVL